MRSEVAERILDATPTEVIQKVRGKGHNLMEFVNNKQAIALKELGYDVPAYAKFLKGKFQFNSLGSPTNYNDGSYGKNIISAPQFSQVFDWFLREHNLRSYRDQRVNVDNPNTWIYDYVIKQGNGIDIQPFFSGDFGSNKESESNCIDKLIEILNPKKK